MAVIKKNLNQLKLKKLTLSLLILLFLIGIVIPTSFSQAKESQNIMPVGTLLYRTSVNGLIYGGTTNQLLKIEHGILKDIYPGHVGIYVGKINGQDTVVEAVNRGVVLNPLKYFVNLKNGEKFLGAKIPQKAIENSNLNKAASAVAIALANITPMKYDFRFHQQKGPHSGDWICVGLAEKIYESADEEAIKSLKILQNKEYRQIFQILQYNPAQYIVDITPDGYDDQHILNQTTQDVFSQTKEFSKIAKRKMIIIPLPEILGVNCGREYKNKRYFFFPYTQFLQPTLKSIHLTKDQISQLESSFGNKIEKKYRGEKPTIKMVSFWDGHNIYGSSQTIVQAGIRLSKLIKTKIKTTTVRIAQRSKELIKKTGAKIKSLFSKRIVNPNNFSANINLNNYSPSNKINSPISNSSAPSISNPKLNTTNTPALAPSPTTPQSTSPTPSPTSNSPQQINGQPSQLSQPTLEPTPTPTPTPAVTPVIVSQPNNLPIQKLNTNPIKISNQTKSSPIIAFIPPPGVPSNSNKNNNPLGNQVVISKTTPNSNTNTNISTTSKETAATTSTITHLSATTTPKISYHSKLIVSTTTQLNCFSFSAQLATTTSAASTTQLLPTPPNLFYHWQFLGLATSSTTTSSTTTLLDQLLVASSTEITATSTLTHCFSSLSLSGQRINQLEINLSIATTSAITSVKNLFPLATTSQTIALSPPPPIKITLANWLEQKRFSTSTMTYSTSGSFCLLGKNGLATSTPNSADLTLTGKINRPTKIKILSTSTLADGRVSTSSTSTEATFSATNFKFAYPLQNSSSTNLIHWQKKIHLSAGDFSNSNFFGSSIDPKSGGGWNEISIQARPLDNSTTSTTTKIAIKIDTIAPKLMGTTATNDNDGIQRGQIRLSWPPTGKMMYLLPPDVDSYLIHYSISSIANFSTSSLQQWWDNSSSSEIIVKNNNRLAPTDNNPPEIIFDSTDSTFTITTSSANSIFGGSAVLSLKPKYLDQSHLQQSYYFFVRAKDFAGNISNLQSDYHLASSTPSHLANHLVIQEIRLDNSSSSQSYIEIYNPPTNATTSLENLALFYIGGSASTSTTSKLTSKIRVTKNNSEFLLPPDSFYLIAATSTTSTLVSSEGQPVNRSYKSLYLSSRNGTLILASTTETLKLGKITKGDIYNLICQQDQPNNCVNYCQKFNLSASTTATTSIKIIDRLAWQKDGPTPKILLPEGKPVKFAKPNDDNPPIILHRRIPGWDINDNSKDFIQIR